MKQVVQKHQGRKKGHSGQVYICPQGPRGPGSDRNSDIMYELSNQIACSDILIKRQSTASGVVKNAFTRHHNWIGVYPDRASCVEIIEGGTIGLNRIMSAVSGAGGAAAGALWGPGCVQGVS